MPVKIDMCEFYSVEPDGKGFKLTCEKEHKASLKCHSANPACSDYKQGIGYTLEETKERFGIKDG